MRAIIVDDEPIMIKKFLRLSSGIADLQVVASFEEAAAAFAYAEKNDVEAAFLDVEMPIVNGIQLAQELRKIRKDIIIIFVSAYDSYIRDSNEIGGDYYIVKPYTTETLEMAMERIRLLSKRQEKSVYIQMFGRFMIYHNGNPVKMGGKAKEILALVATKRGKEISNEEIYSTIWEGREYSNSNMSVYYNALKRLKEILKQEGIKDLLFSTTRGQMLNIQLCDCDYFDWQDNNRNTKNSFEGEFLSEYSWAEYTLAKILGEENFF